MLRRTATFILLTVAIILVFAPSVASVPISATDTTMTVNESGAIHIRVIQSVQDDKDGATDYHFDLQKMYRPENIAIYDYGTGNPLKFDLSETSDVLGYNVHFDRPYYEGYRFVVEYDSHNRIIYEGSGAYSLGMRPAVDTRMIERTSTVILPPKNFTYTGYNAALDHPVSVTDRDGGKWIVFHNVSDDGASYAWEVRFRATGIDGEVRKMDAPNYKIPIPGMSFLAALAAFVILAMARKR